MIGIEKPNADFSLSVENAELLIYLRSGFYQSHGSRWKILHSHPNYEIQFFSEGSFDFFLENGIRHIEAPAMMVLSPNESHSFYSDSEKAQRVCIEFSVEKRGEGTAYGEYSKLLKDIGRYKIFQNEKTAFLEYLKNIGSKPEFERDALIRSAVAGAVIDAFGIMRRHDDPHSNDAEKPHHTNKRNEILAEILAYIEENYEKQITLNEVAKARFVSPRQVQRILKKEFGENFTEVVNRCRIENICREIVGGNEDYKTLSSQNGFSDYTTFWRNFKRYTGMSPTAFLRQKNRSE